MGHRIDLKRVVAARTRVIAGRAPRGAGARGGAGEARIEAPAWLSRLVELLPERAREALRAALGDHELLARAREALEQARREREDLRHREAALDAARSDLDRARAALEEARLEIRAREREAERLLASARRAAAEAAVERRVPVGDIRADLEASPRPIRGVARFAANIKRFGQLVPMTVTPEGDGYRLVTGYRRLAALKKAGVTHAFVRVLDDIDPAAAAALYVAENCLVDGVLSKAVERLAERRGEAPGFAEVLPLVLADDEAVEEEMYLDEMAGEARDHLAEGAGWVAALRPHWTALDDDDRRPLEQLIGYFARVAARLGR